jgi:multiple sugar transport system permease protein
MSTVTVSASGGRRVAHRLGLVARIVIAAMVALLFVLPLLSVVLSSFKTAREASQSPPTLIPHSFSLENYLGLSIGDTSIWNYLGNSLVVTLGTVALTLVVATLAAYGFSRLPFIGSRVISGLMLGAIMIPFQVILTPLYVVTHGLGLGNSLVGLVLVYTTFQLPFSMFLLKNAFDAIPNELFEAAEMDGAGRMRTLRAMLPLLRPGLVTTALFAFFAAWNEFIAALILLADQDKFTLPILLTTLVNGELGSIDWGVLQAGVVLTIVPCGVIFLILQRHYVSGLVAGAVK